MIAIPPNADRYYCSVCRKCTLGPRGKTHVKCSHCGADNRETEAALELWREALAVLAVLAICAWGVL